MHELLNIWHVYFAPQTQPWYDGAVWPNVAAMFPCGIISYMWVKLKVVGRIEELHAKHDALAESHAEIHRKLDELGSA